MHKNLETYIIYSFHLNGLGPKPQRKRQQNRTTLVWFQEQKSSPVTQAMARVEKMNRKPMARVAQFFSGLVNSFSLSVGDLNKWRHLVFRNYIFYYLPLIQYTILIVCSTLRKTQRGTCRKTSIYWLYQIFLKQFKFRNRINKCL